MENGTDEFAEVFPVKICGRLIHQQGHRTPELPGH
jgi:hypothetical protein